MTSILSASGTLRMTPARVLTLAIGVPVILALIAWTGFTLVSQAARASFPISYVMAVQRGQLTAGVNGADITVRQADGGSARLAGTVHYGLFRPRVTRSGNEVNVNCPGISSNCGLAATLDVPRLAGLTLSSGGGNLTVPGVAQAVNLTSDGGNVRVSGVPDAATVRTGGGNLTAGDMGGALKFTTDGGDVNIIVPRGATSYRVSTTADRGDDRVTVPQSASSGDQITVDSGGGDITISEVDS
jgi:hypothetical protein